MLIIILKANQERSSCAHEATSTVVVITETTQAWIRIALALNCNSRKGQQ